MENLNSKQATIVVTIFIVIALLGDAIFNSIFNF